MPLLAFVHTIFSPVFNHWGSQLEVMAPECPHMDVKLTPHCYMPVTFCPLISIRNCCPLIIRDETMAVGCWRDQTQQVNDLGSGYVIRGVVSELGGWESHI